MSYPIMATNISNTENLIITMNFAQQYSKICHISLQNMGNNENVIITMKFTENSFQNVSSR